LGNPWGMDPADRLSWAAGLEPPSAQTTFFNFLASHDGIGVVPATGILSPTEVQALCAQIERHGGHVSYKNNPDGSQSAYELNCTFFDALSDPADTTEPESLKVDRFLAAQSIMLAMQGVPGIYVHSLIGSHNDPEGVAATGRFRSINREKWERATLDARLADAESHWATVFRRFAALIRARRGERAFHPNGPQQVLPLHDGLFALLRRPPASDSGIVLCLHSVSSQPLRFAVDVSTFVGPQRQFTDLLTGGRYLATDGQLQLTLAPYGVLWLKGGS
nr:hypothetical protein [Chloroflexaceae bacterium]